MEKFIHHSSQNELFAYPFCEIIGLRIEKTFQGFYREPGDLSGKLYIFYQINKGVVITKSLFIQASGCFSDRKPFRNDNPVGHDITFKKLFDYCSGRHSSTKKIFAPTQFLIDIT